MFFGVEGFWKEGFMDTTHANFVIHFSTIVLYERDNERDNERNVKHTKAHNTPILDVRES